MDKSLKEKHDRLYTESLNVPYFFVTVYSGFNIYKVSSKEDISTLVKYFHNHNYYVYNETEIENGLVCVFYEANNDCRESVYIYDMDYIKNGTKEFLEKLEKIG